MSYVNIKIDVPKKQSEFAGSNNYSTNSGYMHVNGAYGK
jgi:hypothetical protein